jgi:hypothetical protein
MTQDGADFVKRFAVFWRAPAAERLESAHADK